AAQKDIEALCRNIEKFEITDEKERIKRAEIAAQKNIRTLCPNIDKFEITDKRILIRFFLEGFPNFIDGISYLHKFGFDNSIKDFDDFMRNLIEHGLISEKEKDIVAIKNGRVENKSFILSCILKSNDHFDLTEKIGKTEDPALELHNKSMHLLGKEIGMDMTAFLDKNHSEKSIQDFYSASIELYKLLGSGFFKSLSIDENTVKKENLPNFVSFLNKTVRLAQIMGTNEHMKDGIDRSLVDTLKGWILGKTTLEQIKISTQKDMTGVLSGLVQDIKKTDKKIELNPENIHKLSANIDFVFEARFQDIFQLENGSISTQQIEELTHKRGDLEVLFTLIARYFGNESRIQEIPLFSRVVDSVLNDEFSRLKFKGDEYDEDDQEGAEKQLSVLSEKGKEAWKQNPYKLEYFNNSENKGFSKEQLLETAKHYFNDQMIDQKHLDLIEEGLTEKIRNISMSNFSAEEIKAVRENQSIDKILPYISGETKKEKLKNLLLLCLATLKETDDYDTFLNVMRIMKSGIDITKIKDDIKALSGKLENVEKGDQAIIFTTLFDDPKLLLSVGDLVETGSCQNYKTGSMIQSLLGYVVDANVKGVLSFPITPKNLNGDNKKFNLLKEKLESRNYEINIDYPNLKLTIDGIEINLGKAMIRRIVKLGKTKDNKAGILMEREYTQNHFAIEQMRKSLNELVFSFSQECKAKLVEGGLNIIGTRNPGGVYSDKSRGIQTSDYSL
ncbi:MAG TPA: hypothetical protein PKC14_02035, partial [Candidatus Absconditabacterales bacterium]|nr:hypothetical protein [Candidatus Absconditabacterales bacterium]